MADPQARSAGGLALPAVIHARMTAGELVVEDVDEDPVVVPQTRHGFRCATCAALGASVTVTFEMEGPHVPGCRYHAGGATPPDKEVPADGDVSPF